MPNPKPTSSQKFLQALDDMVTRPELTEFFTTLLETVKTFRRSFEELLQSFKTEIKNEIAGISSRVDASEQKLRAEIQSVSEVGRSDSRTIQRLVEYEIEKVREEIPEQFDSHGIESVFSEQISQIEKKFAPLSNKQELEKAITGLRVELQTKIDELRQQAQTSIAGVGNVTNLRIQQAFKYILKTEQPSGDIDGVNTEYTVKQPIFAILSFALNGETVAQLPNYTVSGKKITFSTAIPAAYSGKDFEVKYI